MFQHNVPVSLTCFLIHNYSPSSMRDDELCVAIIWTDLGQ